MNSCKPIRSLGALLLALFLCACAAQAHANAAAVVLFSHGSVHAIAANGQRHPVAKGDDVLAGDTIITGRNGRIQMRFSDGGLVSLMPGSKFVVEDYRQPTSASGGSLVFNLVEGGLRTVTGSIGHKNHGDYKLKTSVATLGIRGTQFVVVMDGDVMRIHVSQGKVKVFNDSGHLFLIGGENGIVIPGKKPEKTDMAPNYVSAAETYTDGLLQNKAASNSGRNPNSERASTARSLPEKLINGSGAESGGPSGGDTPGADTPGGETPGGDTTANPGFAIAYRPGGGAPVRSTSYGEQAWQQAVQDAGGGLPTSVPDFLPVKPDTPIADIQPNPPTINKTGQLVWGEVLTGADSSTGWQYYQPYVWGIPTANMPTGGTLHYSLADATTVRYVKGGGHSSGTLSAFHLAIDLNGTAAPLFRAALELQLGGTTLSPTMPSSVAGTMDGAAFKFDSDLINDAGCNNCLLSVAGVLSGTNAEQAGVVYKLLDNLYTPDTEVGVATGAAVLYQPQPR